MCVLTEKFFFRGGSQADVAYTADTAGPIGTLRDGKCMDIDMRNGNILMWHCVS